MKNLSGLLAVLEKNTSLKFLVVTITIFISHLGFAQQEATLNPTDDVYLENGARHNNETLRLEASSRVRESFLKFDLSGINGTITALELELTVYDDAGSGLLNVYQGFGNNWTEKNLSNSNKPSTPNSPIGTLGTSHVIGNVKTLNISPGILNGSDILILVLKHTTPSDMAFASSGPDTGSAYRDLAPQSQWPKLKVTYTTTTSDTQAPNIPTSLTVNSFDHESANISWNASSDNGGGSVAGYNIYNNNSFLTNTTGTSATLTGLSADTAYHLTVAAYDDATSINTSNQSVPVNFTTSTAPGGNGGTGTGGSWTQANSNIHYTTGNVGIGTTNIGSWKLAVNGNIRAKEIKVETGWADYVFLNEYKLPTLQEVEQHIQEKGHLINIPSAAEVEANGIELGEMNKLLLEKIEELTLYVIQQNKSIVEQNKILVNLRKRIKYLEKTSK